MKHLTHGTVAVATAIACLLLLQSPASANTFSSSSVTGGTLTLTKTAVTPLVISLNSGDCPTGFLSVDVDPVAGPTATVDILGLSLHRKFTYSSNTYVASITRTGSNAGVSTSSPDKVANVGLSTTLTIHNLAVGTDCGLGTRICGLSMAHVHSGTHSGFTIGASSTMSLSSPASLLTLVFPCGAPFSAFIGGQSTATGLGIHLA